MVFVECPSFAIPMFGAFIELEDGKIYRSPIFDGKNHGFL
jgi:hypothetical protein